MLSPLGDHRKRKEMYSSNGKQLARVEESHQLAIRLIPPDGGWGWAIVGANFILGILVHSVSTAFGVVYVTLVQLGNSNAAASGIPALLTGISCLFGPFSTSLSLYYSYRVLALIGIAFLGIGMCLSSITLQLPWLYFTYGILGGIGHSLVTPQIFMIGQQYFHKKRVTSHALASLGNTAGFMIMPIFIYALISFYSLQGAFLIWSSVMFNGFVAAMLYQPVEWHFKKEFCEEEGNMETNHLQEGSSEHNEETTENLGRSEHFVENDDAEFFESHDQDSRQMDDVFLDVRSNGRPASFMSVRSMDSFKTTKSYYKSTETMMMVSCLNIPDTFGSVISLRNIEKKNGTLPDEKEGDFELDDNEKVVEMKNNPCIICGLKFPRMSEIISLKLLTNPIFIIYVCSTICTRQLYYSFQTYLPSIAQQVISKPEVPYLFSIVAIVEVFSKICIAIVSDRGWIARRYYYIVGGIINCAAIVGFAVAQSFKVLGIAAALYGFGIGITTSIGPVLMVEHLSLSLLPHTYGLSLFIGGIFNILMYFILGWTIDATGSTNVLCFIIAALALVPSILWSLASIFLLKIKPDAAND